MYTSRLQSRDYPPCFKANLLSFYTGSSTRATCRIADRRVSRVVLASNGRCDKFVQPASGGSRRSRRSRRSTRSRRSPDLFERVLATEQRGALHHSGEAAEEPPDAEALRPVVNIHAGFRIALHSATRSVRDTTTSASKKTSTSPVARRAPALRARAMQGSSGGEKRPAESCPLPSLCARRSTPRSI